MNQADPLKPYSLSQPNAEEYLNKFWQIYGLSEGVDGMNGWDDGPLHPSVFWYEWNMLKLAWNGYSTKAQKWQRDLFLSQKVNGINAADKQANGYLWPEPSNPRWFGIQYHFDHLPRYIVGAYLYYVWSGDREFLNSIMPKLQAVMGYMWDTMKLSDGIAICPGNNTGLPNTGEVTTYMDCIRSGYMDGWTNTAVYTALQCMAELEETCGHAEYAKRYADGLKLMKSQFDKQLWNEKTRRYAGWRDIKRTLHDCGYTYINVEALARGLGDAEKAMQIFNWLDTGKAQPVVKGGHVGSKDIYQLVVAPRSNTIRIPNDEWDTFSHVNRNAQGDAYQYAYGGLVEDGGTMLWVNYYDVMARLRWQDADRAYVKFTDMLYRCANDSRFLSYGRKGSTNWRSYNDFAEHFLALGTNYDFPESGLAAMSMLYGFMGVTAKTTGLYAAPNLPSSLLSASCSGIGYRGKDYSLEVRRGTSVSAQTQRDTADIISPDHPLSQNIEVTNSFDMVGVFTGNFATKGAVYRFSLHDLSAYNSVIIASMEMRCDPDNTWQYLPVDGCKPGRYRIVLEHISGQIAWHKHSKMGYVWSAAAADYRVVQSAIKMRRVNSSFETKFTTDQPYSRMAIGMIETVPAELTLSLRRKMGRMWCLVMETNVKTASDMKSLVVDLADQPAGEYWLQIKSKQSAFRFASVKLRQIQYHIDINAEPEKFVAAGSTLRIA